MFRLINPIITAFLFAYSVTAGAVPDQLQSIASIKSAVDHFINNEFKATEQFKYNLAQLDPRLQLPMCGQALTVFSHAGALKAGNNSLGIRCDGDRKWTIFTVAQIQAFKKVVVLTQPLPRGTIIEKRHLAFATRDIADLRYGYLTDPDNVVGKQAKRNLAGGTALNRALIVEPKIVKKGERVNIEAGSAYFNISMTGIAMMDGSRGDPIRVKNINSQRIIQATVVEPGRVAVH